MIDTKIGNSWDQVLEQEFEKDYFKNLLIFLNKSYTETTIYPEQKFIFNALTMTPLDKVKAVIIGQDPYHGPGQAHGLCFSVLPDIKTPRSLKNIYKEMKTDLNLPPVDNGHLINWARQGVLMLNTVLTVEKGLPGSHRKKGWEQFTDHIIKTLSTHKQHLAFILWGNDAKKKKELVDPDGHLILESAHPSPFSVKKFYGTKPFSKTNSYLLDKNIEPINWNLE